MYIFLEINHIFSKKSKVSLLQKSTTKCSMLDHTNVVFLGPCQPPAAWSDSQSHPMWESPLIYEGSDFVPSQCCTQCKICACCTNPNAICMYPPRSIPSSEKVSPEEVTSYQTTCASFTSNTPSGGSCPSSGPACTGALPTAAKLSHTHNVIPGRQLDARTPTATMSSRSRTTTNTRDCFRLQVEGRRPGTALVHFLKGVDHVDHHQDVCVAPCRQCGECRTRRLK